MTLAHVYTVAFEGCSRAKSMCRSTSPIPAGASSRSWASPTRRWANRANGCARPWPRWGLALPFKRITVNLAPADLPKEGSHYDLPIALALLAAMGVLPASEMAGYTAMGELSLDGQITAVAGVLPAAIAAVEAERGLICPAACGSEAAWAGELEIIAAPSLIALVNHIKGAQVLATPEAAAGGKHDVRSGFERREGPGDRQARARNRGGRRPQHADDRPAGRGQIHAGEPLAGVAAAARRARGAGSLHGAEPGRRIARGHDFARAPLSLAASFGLDGGAGRRRAQGEAGRGEPCPSWRAVSRRAAGIRAPRSGFLAPADRIGRGGDRARQRPCALPRAVPIGGGDESLPLRLSDRSGAELRPRAQMRAGLSGADFGAAARPHRHSC